VLIFFVSCSPLKKHLSKGEDNLLKGNLQMAEYNFRKAYKIDSNNYAANVWLGTTLSEYMAKYDEALPFLERAERISPKDTAEDVFNSMALAYHYQENYDKALLNYRKMKRYKTEESEDIVFQKTLAKNHTDCEFAQNNQEEIALKNTYIANLGSQVNTKQPEYVPVIMPNNDLLFTSKRQDTKEEKYNPNDGKYYESMYISKFEGNQFKGVRRYTVPDLMMKSQYKKGHESVISISADGKILYVFRNGKIYEYETSKTNNDASKLSKAINFNYYQNHAFLSKDSKTLFFTSEEGEKGLGGNDIYKTQKQDDGTWSVPENIGNVINTGYDEDSPFLSDDGKTLYFSSKGHDGFGGFDIYKSELVNGSFTKPVNLGRPINSVANDIFYIINRNDSSAYFSSNRRGGKGDMDIYKVNYNVSINKPCNVENFDLVNLSVNRSFDNSLSKDISFELKSNSNKVVDFAWSVNGINDLPKKESFTYVFSGTESKELNLKIVLWCDTCYNPIIVCQKAQVVFDEIRPAIDTTKQPDIVSNDKLKNIGFDLNSIYFDFNSYKLRQDAIAIIQQNIKVLKQNTNLKIDVIGHTDSRGNDEYNKRLSQARAKAVKDYLVLNGISKQRIISLKAKGESELINNCKDQADCDDAMHQQNRRVEFVIAK
jgi:outer membrane protein OmpA-like peptidoglycan-associated protein/tetratricopeptide (TPR) repeat protein